VVADLLLSRARSWQVREWWRPSRTARGGPTPSGKATSSWRRPGRSPTSPTPTAAGSWSSCRSSTPSQCLDTSRYVLSKLNFNWRELSLPQRNFRVNNQLTCTRRTVDSFIGSCFSGPAGKTPSPSCRASATASREPRSRCLQITLFFTCKNTVST
jgi:hypothetical protein